MMRKHTTAPLGRLLPIGVAAAVLAAVLPDAAAAADYCVYPNTSCGGTKVNTLQEALDKADDNNDADRVFLGASTYYAPPVTGYVYQNPTAPVEIVGRGRGETVLTSWIGVTAPVLKLAGGSGSLVRDLSVHLGKNAPAGSSALTTDGSARRIEVTEEPVQANAHSGVSLFDGGILEDSGVKLDLGGNSRAVSFGAKGGTVRRSRLIAYAAVYGNYGGTVERSRLNGTIGVAARAGLTAIRASVIQAGIGIWAAPLGADAEVRADGVTMHRPNAGTGVAANTVTDPGHSAHVTLTNSVLRDYGVPLAAHSSGAGVAKVVASYSDYDAGQNDRTGHATIMEQHVTDVGDAKFADGIDGDYRLLPGSPLLDRGDPAGADGLDMAGNPLLADGNGDGTARRDLGAYELQPELVPVPAPPPPTPTPPPVTPPPPPPSSDAPKLSGVRVAPKRVRRGNVLPVLTRSTKRSRIELAVSKPSALEFRFMRRADGAWKSVRGRIRMPASRITAGTVRIRFAGRLSKTRWLKPAAYRVRVAATDAAGNRSQPASASFRLRR